MAGELSPSPACRYPGLWDERIADCTSQACKEIAEQRGLSVVGQPVIVVPGEGVQRHFMAPYLGNCSHRLESHTVVKNLRSGVPPPNPEGTPYEDAL